MQFHIEIWVYGFCRIGVCIACILHHQIVAIVVIKGNSGYLAKQFTFFVRYTVNGRFYIVKILLAFKWFARSVLVIERVIFTLLVLISFVFCIVETL